MRRTNKQETRSTAALATKPPDLPEQPRAIRTAIARRLNHDQIRVDPFQLVEYTSNGLATHNDVPAMFEQEAKIDTLASRPLMHEQNRQKLVQFVRKCTHRNTFRPLRLLIDALVTNIASCNDENDIFRNVCSMVADSFGVTGNQD